MKSSKKRVNCCDLQPIPGDLNFHGNVEGNDIFKGTVDIVVCDGFVGNVALEGQRRLGNHDQRLFENRVFSQYLHENCGNFGLSGLNCI